MIITEVVPKHHVCKVVTSGSSAAADDGESSVSSTVTVVHSSSVEVVLGGQQEKMAYCSQHQHCSSDVVTPTKKSVRFDESQNKIYLNFRTSKNDCPSLWYSARDYITFKAGTKCMALEISKFEKLNKAPHSYERVMTRAYLACVRHPCEVEEELECEEHDESSWSSTASTSSSSSATRCCSNNSVLDRDEQRHMKKWMEISINRLGVERISIRQIARDRAARRLEMSRVVLKLQELQASSHRCPHADFDDPYHYCKAELIRRACMSITRPSRLFARQLAQAQSASLHDVV